MFLWSATRTVDKTAAVAMFGNHYEVDPALVGARVELIYEPFDLSVIEVRYQGRPMGQAVVRRIRRHTHPQARPETAPPARSSGIDYLGLVAARVAAEQARRIAYSAIDPQDSDDTDNDTEKPR